MKEVVYLAARYARRLEMHGPRDALVERGYRVISRWLDGHELPNDWDEETHARLRSDYARDDLQDLFEANVVVAFTEEPRAQLTSPGRGGRHVELGYALAMKHFGRPVRILVVGPKENIFCCLSEVEVYPSFPEALAAL